MTMNEERASTPPKRAGEGGSRSNKSKKTAKTPKANCPTSADLAKSLIGTKLHFLSNDVLTLPPAVSKDIVDLSKSTLKLSALISEKSKRLEKFESATEEEPYIPNSVRIPLRVTVPSTLKDNRKDSGKPIPEAQEKLDAIKKIYEDYCLAASKTCHEFLKLEIETLKNDRVETVLKTLFTLILSEVFVADVPCRAGATYTYKEIAYTSAIHFIETSALLPRDQLFLLTDSTDREEIKIKLTKTINDKWGNDTMPTFDLTSTRAKFNENNEEDIQRITQHCNAVRDTFIRATISIITNNKTATNRQTASARLEALFRQRDIDTDTEMMAEALDDSRANIEESVRNIAREEAIRATRSEERKRELHQRKKSSAAGTDAQDLQHTSNGRGGRGRGRESDGRSRQQQWRQQRNRSPSPSSVRFSNRNSQHNYNTNDPPNSVLRNGRFNRSYSERYYRGGGNHREGRGRGGFNRGRPGGRSGRN